MSNRKYIFSITLGISITLLTLFLLAVIFGWLGEWNHTGAEFCEASRAGLIKQPANTWSNIGFVIAGLTIAWQLSRNVFQANKNIFTQNSFTAIFFSSLTVFLGPGSMAMHATETSAGGFLDMLSMYLVAAFITAYAVQRFFRLSSLLFALIFGSIVCICVCVQDLPYRVPLVGFFGNFVFGFFITVTVIFEALNAFVRKSTCEIQWGIWSILALLTAFLIWNLERNFEAFCNPYSLIQGHAIWHLLDALAVYFLFRFYVSERQSVSA